MENIDFGNLIIWFIVLLFSLSFHEAAHAWTSERFGDDTGRMQGRISLNPMAHIDPIGTVVFPIVGFFTGFPLLGWAKPVQTNPLLWRDKTRANISVSAAGPISNFILAFIAFIIIKVLIIGGVLFPIGGFFTMVVPAGAVFTNVTQPAYLEPLAKFLSVMLMLNIALGVFNLIPVPPLDGSHVLEEMLPPAMAGAYEQIRPYGFILLYALLLLGVFSAIFIPVSRLVEMLLGAQRFG
ncbi:MAG TPA: site-2 protease family protein [Blastocatellia bacterium]|nr:site-2 protease family protein [Blastocatellia bacterium]